MVALVMGIAFLFMPPSDTQETQLTQVFQQDFDRTWFALLKAVNVRYKVEYSERLYSSADLDEGFVKVRALGWPITTKWTVELKRTAAGIFMRVDLTGMNKQSQKNVRKMTEIISDLMKEDLSR